MHAVWNKRTQLFLIIQRSGLVELNSGQISVYWACTPHRVVFAKQLSPWTWGATLAAQASGWGSFIICVPPEQTFTPLWPHLTPCHSAAKWGNHARGNCRFGPRTRHFSHTGPLFTLSQCLHHTKSIHFYYRETWSGQRGRKQAWCSASVLHWDGWIPADPLLCCKGQPLSFHTERYVPICYYRATMNLIKSLTAKDSSKWINHDINLLYNQKLHYLMTIALFFCCFFSATFSLLWRNKKQQVCNKIIDFWNIHIHFR